MTLHIDPSQPGQLNFAEQSAKQLVGVVQVAASTIDERGAAQPHPDLTQAVANLDERQRQVMVTGLAMMRAVRNRQRALPTASAVGQELAPVLQAMNGCPEDTLKVLAVALDRADLNEPMVTRPPELEPLPPAA